MDLIPIVPYTTDSIVIGNGQRYDIVITANAATDNYWLRAIYNSDCGSINHYLDNIKGIIRYDASSTADPVTTTQNYTAICRDEDYSNLVPYVAQNVGEIATQLSTNLSYLYNNDIWQWTLNTSTLIVNWSEPTVVSLYNNGGPTNLDLPTNANLWELTQENGWVYLVLNDNSATDLGHPIHLHGHDYFILGSGNGTFDTTALSSLNLINPPRRDTAVLPGNGYLVMAFMVDNPGAWLLHCHIAWHASEGMGLQFLELGDQVIGSMDQYADIEQGCKNWDAYALDGVVFQDDAGI